MLRRLGVSAAWCVLVVGARAAGPPDPWIRIKSTNFELLTTAGDRAGRDLIRYFEQVHAFFAEAMGFTGAGSRKVRIVAFRSEREFEPYRPNEVATAFFQTGLTHDSIVMGGAGAEHYGEAVHEYTHLLLEQTKQKIPLWFNEGLADLFSSLQPAGTKVTVGKPLPGRIYALRTQKWLDLSAIVGAGHESSLYNEKARAGMFYAESWLLVHMIQLGPTYRPRLRNFLDAIVSSDAETAFQRAYGKSVREVQSDLEGYARSDRVMAAVFSVQLPKSVEAPEIQSGAGLQARVALAEVLGENRRKQTEAAAAYAALAADFPGRWEVERGLAEHTLRQGLADEAVRHFARAEELGAKEAEMYVEYGRALEASSQPTEAVRELRKALALDGNVPEGRLELGIALARAGSYGAAVVEFQAIKTVKPDQAMRYYYHLAYSYFRLGAADEARAILAKARPYAKTVFDKEGLESLAAAVAHPVIRPPAVPAGERVPVAPRPASLLVTEGVLMAVDCRGQTAALRVATAGKTLLFLITDPNRVLIRGAEGARVQLNCGPQPKTPIRITYEPAPEGGEATGIVRGMEFP
jgi:tetratricopeptide (TPR) repeat protein